MMLIPKWGNYPGDGGGGITLVIHRRSIIGFGEKQPARFEYDPTGKLAQEADQGPNLR